MQISGLHILLTYQCTFACDHCFVWGSPWQRGTLTLAQIEDVLGQAQAAGVDTIYYEGGEPFLYYALLLRGVDMAHAMGFQVGIVSNAYWAQTHDDAIEWLRPLAGKLFDLSISSDSYHYSEETIQQVKNAVNAARHLNIPVGTISVAPPEATDATNPRAKLEGEAGVVFRGRAAEQLASRATKHPWDQFNECPYEDLREPGRIHLDPLGNLHICQGISIGNLFEKPLKEICVNYDPEAHPVCGPLLAGGPAELVRQYNLPHDTSCADACHLCYEARKKLRSRLPEALGPDQMYGVG